MTQRFLFSENVTFKLNLLEQIGEVHSLSYVHFICRTIYFPAETVGNLNQTRRMRRQTL
ncbi:MAG TPA: hypothetical protein IGS53_26140 [Leptolyngbyaceae cyanobacterium M33_DOE_097]|nr:hypothetical protein [Leptolyngbyaceae cyanobacterium M33_DOE_097]